MEVLHSFNAFDCIVLSLILISGLLAVFSGFLREMYSLFNWIASAYIGSHFYTFAEPYIGRYLTNPKTVKDLSIFAVFCLSFIVLALLGNIVGRFGFQDKTLNSINRSLGFVFGLGRGVFLVCLLYLIATTLMWPDMDKVPLTPTTLSPGPAPAPAPVTVQAANPAVDPTAQLDAVLKSPDPAGQLNAMVKSANNKKTITYSPPQWLTTAQTRPLLSRGAQQLKEFVPADVLEKTTSDYFGSKNTDKYEGILDSHDGIKPIPTTTTAPNNLENTSQ